MTIASETISLRPLPVKKPRNENHADFNAVLKFLRSWISSPTNAPKNGPRRMPIMFPVNTPSITPTIAPLEPAFDPPDFFVKKMSIMPIKPHVMHFLRIAVSPCFTVYSYIFLTNFG